MQSRTASLQVSHSAWCPNRTKSSVASVDRACKAAKCKPRYFTLHREVGADGRIVKVKGERVADRQTAEKILNKLQVELDEGRSGISKQKDLTFREWANEFQRICEQRISTGTMKGRTLVGYRETIDLHANPAFGGTLLRRIGPAELRTFFDRTTRTRVGAESSVSSRLRHLRHLNVIFVTAVDENDGLLDANPVASFKKRLKLKPPRRGKAPFEDGELAALWTAYEARVAQPKKPYQPVYYWATRFAVETGLRIGELVAVDLDDLRGTDLHVRHTLSPEGLVAPKDGEARTVYLTKEALAVLARWLPVRGDADGPLFPNPSGGRLVIRELQRKFAVVMEDAGVEHLHPELGLPRSFHSLRYSLSNQMQRRGYHPRLIEATLGHSNLELTYGVYGSWTPDQLRAEASRD
jgi:integrase